MTWGQIRLNLLTTTPGIPLDLLDEWINSRYTSVLEATDWIGLKGHTTIETTPAYQSGADTITATVGQTAVVGVGTAWNALLQGLVFYIPGDTAVYTITFVSPTQITLDRPYEGRGNIPVGTVYAASPYVIMQDIYPLPTDCRSIVTVLGRGGFPLQPFTKDGLDRSAGTRARVGYPEAWAEYDDSPAAPVVVHQIQLSPAPLNQIGYSLEYLRNAQAFDGRTLTASPLPFVTPAVILAGVRADIAIFQEKPATKVAAYQLQFDKELARMLLVEHTQRRVKAALKMADRFTRHRMIRVERGLRYLGGGMPNPPIDQP
jgi:hypothetical protein